MLEVTNWLSQHVITREPHSTGVNEHRCWSTEPSKLTPKYTLHEALRSIWLEPILEAYTQSRPTCFNEKGFGLVENFRLKYISYDIGQGDAFAICSIGLVILTFNKSFSLRDAASTEFWCCTLAGLFTYLCSFHPHSGLCLRFRLFSCGNVNVSI